MIFSPALHLNFYLLEMEMLVCIHPYRFVKMFFFVDLCKMRDRIVSQQQMQLSMRQPQTSLPQNQLKAQPQWLQQQQKLLRHIGAKSGGVGTVESTSPGSGLATQGRLLAQTQIQSAQSSSPLLLSKLPPSPFSALSAG